MQTDNVRPMSRARQNAEQLFLQTETSSHETPSGWVKPQAPVTVESLNARIAELNAEREKVMKQRDELLHTRRLEAIVQVRNLIRGFDISLEELQAQLSGGRRDGRPRLRVADISGGPARASKPPKTALPVKYRRGPGEEWCGMGKWPDWVHDVVGADKSRENKERKLACFLVRT